MGIIPIISCDHLISVFSDTQNLSDSLTPSALLWDAARVKWTQLLKGRCIRTIWSDLDCGNAGLSSPEQENECYRESAHIFLSFYLWRSAFSAAAFLSPAEIKTHYP